MGSGTQFWIADTHSYENPGNYVIDVIVYNSQGMYLEAMIDDLACAHVEGPGQVIDLGSFTDANTYADPSSYSTTDVGDGFAGSGGTYTVSRVIPDLEEGIPVEETVSLWDETLSLDWTADVVAGDAPLEEDSVTALTGTQFTAIASTTLATFLDTDSDAADETFTAFINWGDGQQDVGTVINDAGVFAVVGHHTYQEAGDFDVNILAQEESSANGIVISSEAVIQWAALEGTKKQGAFVGIPTSDQVPLASFAGDLDPSIVQNLEVNIDWGDGSNTPGTIEEQGGHWVIEGSHDYVASASGGYPVDIHVTDTAIDGTSVTDSISATFTMDVAEESTYFVPTNDPFTQKVIAIGEIAVGLNAGTLRLSHPLDFDLNPGTDVGGNPALDYNSQSALPDPVVQVTLVTDLGQPFPASVQLQLTWNDAAPVTSSFSLTGTPGDSIVLAIPIDKNYFLDGGSGDAYASGNFSWTLDLEASYTSSPAYMATGQFSGETPVAVNHGNMGYGWGIDGVTQLLPVRGGMLMLSGSGDYEFFAADGASGFADKYTTIPGDFGTLSRITTAAAAPTPSSTSARTRPPRLTTITVI